MNSSIYRINKGINKSIEFKGLKAQYIWWLAAGIVCLLLLFVILYMIGVNSYICIGVIAIAGVGVFVSVYKLSNRYGEHGLKKKIAAGSIPKVVKCYSRKLFTHFK